MHINKKYAINKKISVLTIATILMFPFYVFADTLFFGVI